MDVVLLGITAGLTTYLPRLSGFGKQGPTQLATGLSLSLFSLSLAELLPTRWLLWLEHGWPIAGAYRWVLWGMTIFCTIVIPCASGTHIFAEQQSSNAVDRDDLKKAQSYAFLRERHWTIRLAIKVISLSTRIAVKSIYFITVAPILRVLCYIKSRCPCEGARSLLPMNSGDFREKKHPFSCLKNPLRSPIVLFIKDPVFRRSVTLGSMFGSSIGCLSLLCISRVVIEPSDSYRPLRIAVSWLCSVGILLSAIMNGFGSVSLPYECLVGVFIDPISPKALANAEAELESTKERLQEKRNSIHVDVVNLPSATPQATSLWPWKRGVKRNFSNVADGHIVRRKKMMQEIDFLETLIGELSEDVEEMRYAQRVSSKARSTSGKIRSCIGFVFSALLITRLLFAISSVTSQYSSGSIQHKAFGIDPVTRMLLWLLGHHIVREEDLHTMSQFISLLLTAFLSVSQMRTFLRTTSTVQRRIRNIYRRLYCKPRICSKRNDSSMIQEDPEAGQASDVWFLSYLVSLLMCCYCLACLVLTKMMLPYEYRSGFSIAMGADESQALFSIRTYAVDFAYSGTALVSTATLTIMLGILRSNGRRYSSGVLLHSSISHDKIDTLDP